MFLDRDRQLSHDTQHACHLCYTMTHSMCVTCVTRLLPGSTGDPEEGRLSVLTVGLLHTQTTPLNKALRHTLCPRRLTAWSIAWPTLDGSWKAVEPQEGPMRTNSRGTGVERSCQGPTRGSVP